MHVLILGGTGFVGRYLTRALMRDNITVSVASRSAGKGGNGPRGCPCQPPCCTCCSGRWRMNCCSPGKIPFRRGYRQRGMPFASRIWNLPCGRCCTRPS